jgi:hypothetical protein
MNTYSARLARRRGPQEQQTAEMRAPQSPPEERVPTPGRKQTAVLGERRLGIEIAQAAMHDLRVEVLRVEIEAEKSKECTFSPVFVSRSRRGASRKKCTKSGRHKE